MIIKMKLSYHNSKNEYGLFLKLSCHNSKNESHEQIVAAT